MAWPPPTGLVSPGKTTLASGPVGLALALAGRLTGPPSIVALVAAPGAATLSSVSSLAPPLYSPTKKLADEPAGSAVEPAGGPSTKALLMEMPFTVAYAPL